jgi:Putative adhesin
MPHSALCPLPSALTIGACALTVLSACDVTIKDGDVSFGQLHGRATQEFSRKYPLATGGRVELINSNGPVEVSAGPAGTVLVTAVLSARAMSDERAKDLLSGARIEESTTPDHVKLTTVRGNRSGGFQVNYKVVVPAEARVEITANNGTIKVDGVRGHVKAMGTNGAIELSGLRGSVDAALVNGAILVKMADVTARIRLEGTNARIALEIPKDTKAMLNARSVNGGLTVTGLPAQETTGRRIRNLESVLNGGGPEIEVRVTNGRMTIEGK